jgi:hypothetical protein
VELDMVKKRGKMIRQKINLINGFCEKFEKEGNNIYTSWIKEIFTDTTQLYEFVLPSFFKPYLESGNFVISGKFNVRWCLKLESLYDNVGVPVIYPINPKDSSYFAILISDITLSFHYSPTEGWYMVTGEYTHGEPVKLNQ